MNRHLAQRGRPTASRGCRFRPALGAWVLALILAIAVLVPAGSRSGRAADDATPEGEQAVFAEAQADAEVAPVETPLPTPTEAPAEIPGGGTEIAADGAATGYPGDIIAFRHTVTHLDGAEVDVKTIAALSSSGWPVHLLAADGVQPLPDSDGDGTPDTGPIERGGWREIVVVVVIPADAAPDAQEITSVFARSAGNPDQANEAVVTDVTTVMEPQKVESTSNEAIENASSSGDAQSNKDDELTVTIAPDNAADADPGETVGYHHTVLLMGDEDNEEMHGDAGVVNVTAESSLGWLLSLFEADGVTPLTDHNEDGIPDTGPLAAGDTFELVVTLVVPDGTLAGVVDATTIAATPRNAAGEEERQNGATSSDTTTVNPVLALSIETGDVDFGAVAPDGDGGGTADASGASYVEPNAITVTVSTNTDAWTGACRVDEVTAPAGMGPAEGALAWQLADGSTSVTPFTMAAPGDPGCFPTHGAGNTTYTYDLQLRVDWTDAPGDYRARVVIAATSD